MLGVAIIGFVSFTFFSFLGFLIRTEQTSNIPSEITRFSNVHLYLSGWRFACHSHGDSMYNPQGILTKVIDSSRTAGSFSPYDGDIHLNLSVIQDQSRAPDTWRGYRAETLEEAVEFVIEHEALHSAIADHKPVELRKRENHFKHQWQQAGLLRKAVLFYTSFQYVFGHGRDWDEEYILSKIQNARQSHQEIQKTKKAVLS